MARLEEILGLPHKGASDPVGKARGISHNRAQVSLVVVYTAWLPCYDSD